MSVNSSLTSFIVSWWLYLNKFISLFCLVNISIGLLLFFSMIIFVLCDLVGLLRHANVLKNLLMTFSDTCVLFLYYLIQCLVASAEEIEHPSCSLAKDYEKYLNRILVLRKLHNWEKFLPQWYTSNLKLLCFISLRKQLDHQLHSNNATGYVTGNRPTMNIFRRKLLDSWRVGIFVRNCQRKMTLRIIYSYC